MCLWQCMWCAFAYVTEDCFDSVRCSGFAIIIFDDSHLGQLSHIAITCISLLENTTLATRSQLRDGFQPRARLHTLHFWRLGTHWNPNLHSILDTHATVSVFCIGRTNPKCVCRTTPFSAYCTLNKNIYTSSSRASRRRKVPKE